MKRIYEGAKQVVVWLGEVTKCSGLPLAKIKEAANLGKNEMTSKTVHWARDELFGTEAWIEFANLFRQEWWTRAWTVQEVTVAKQVILVWGDHHIPAACFDRAITSLLALRLFSTRRAGFVDLGEEFDYIRQVQNLRGASNDLLYLADNCRRLEASDPRDKLYALLGLAGEIDFEPDYEVSVRESLSEICPSMYRKVRNTGCSQLCHGE